MGSMRFRLCRSARSARDGFYVAGRCQAPGLEPSVHGAAREHGDKPSDTPCAFCAKTRPMRLVGQANPLGTVRREDPVLLAKVVDDGLLLSIDPA